MLKKLLNKQDWDETDCMRFLLECSASSARFGVIKEKEEKQNYITRGNMHVMVVLPFGTGKTTSFINIKDAVKAFDITFPGLIGTINKEGEVVESAIMKAGGKILIIDEFQTLSEDVKNALNSILEYPHVYSRTLGYKIRSNVNKRSKFFYIKAKQNSNKFEVFSKFSCIAGGTYISKKTSIGKAWFSRFVPIRFMPSIDYYEKLSRGEKIINVNPCFKEADFVFPKYLDFNKKFWDKVKQSKFFYFFENNPNERGYLVRLLQDLVRIGAVVASLESRKTIRVEDCEVGLRLIDFILSSYVTWDLDEVELYILSNLAQEKQVDIARKFGISKQAVSEKVEKLKKARLIE